MRFDNFQTPILFLIFNRPTHARRVFEAIKKLKPAFLYVAADGARADKPGEDAKCELTKKIVLEGIDWDCELKVLDRDENLGCGKAVSEAISWFFDHVEEGIILEDDCLPDPSFFAFCRELLDKYRKNQEVMHIGGSNFQTKKLSGNHSYYFSNYIHVWGWATWRDAWQRYEFNIPAHPNQHFQYTMRAKFPNSVERNYWKTAFAGMAAHNLDTWDIQWNYCIYKFAGVSITPAVNMVSNIGFDAEATHTRIFSNDVAERTLDKIDKIIHPKKIRILKAADMHTFKTQFQHGNTRFNKIKFKIGMLFPFVKKIYLLATNKASLSR